MPAIQLNFCPFCGNELKMTEELCPFCDRDISFFYSDHVLELTAAHLILNCLEEMPKDFGRYVLASVLKGSASQVILDNDLDRNPYYGDLGKLSKKDIINMIDLLIERGFVDTVVQEEEISIIRVSERGMLALDSKDLAWVRLPFPLATQLEPIFTHRQKAVMPELRSMRKNLAMANGIPNYLVFNDDTLKDIALKLPITLEELEKVKGIKEVRAKKYAEEILETVRWALEDFDRKEDQMKPGEPGESFPVTDRETTEDDSVETDGSGESETRENGVVFAKIPLKRIAVSRETGEKLNICSSCGGYFPLSQDACPHCMDEEDIEEMVAVVEEIESEQMVKCPYCEEDFGIDEEGGIYEMACPHCHRVGVISTSQGRMFAFPENAEFEDDDDDEDEEDKEEGEYFDEFEDDEEDMRGGEKAGTDDDEEEDSTEEYEIPERDVEDGDVGGAEAESEEDSTDEHEGDEGDIEDGDFGGTEVESDEDSSDEHEVESDEDSTDDHEVDEGEIEDGDEGGAEIEGEEDSTDDHEVDEGEIEDGDVVRTEVEGGDDEPTEEFDETESIEMLPDEDDGKSDDMNVLSEIFSTSTFTESLKEGGEVVDVETVGGGEREQEPQRFELDLDESEDYSVETSDSPSRKEEKDKDEDKDEEEDPFKIEVDD